jgi:aryl-alcohol dehydrogenase-like predicted oxidoreductase
MTHIDTAELYGSGAAEEVVAKRLPERAMKSSWSQKSFPKMPLAAGR